MANPFDEFDTQVNPFDEFDAPSKKPDLKELLKAPDQDYLTPAARAMVANIPGMLGAYGQAGLDVVAQPFKNLATGKGLQTTDEDISNILAKAERTRKGLSFTDSATQKAEEGISEAQSIPGEAAFKATEPILGLGGASAVKLGLDLAMNLDPALVAKGAKGALSRKKIEAKPEPKAVLDETPAAKPNPFDEFDGMTLKPEEAGAGPMRPEPEYTPYNRRQMDMLAALDQSTEAPRVVQVDPAGTGIPHEMSPTDILAQERAGQLQEAELNKTRPLENQTSLEGPEGQMSMFDQADLMGQRNQFNAGNLGDWRIDENGMPVRADLSQEAMNLGNPLQRNLWGDELGPALGQERGMLHALDTLEHTPFKGDARDAALAALGDPRATTNMFSSGFDFRNKEGESIGLFGQGHRGENLEFPKIDTSGLSLAEPGANLSGKAFKPNAVDKNGHPIEIERNFDHDNISYKVRNDQGDVIAQVQFEQNPDGSLGAGMVQSFQQGRGAAEALYRAAKQDGFTIRPGRAQTVQGEGLVKRLQEKGIIEPGKTTPTSEYRADSMASAKIDHEPQPQNDLFSPRTPELIKENLQREKLAEKLPGEPLGNFKPIKTFELAEAKAAGQGFKDNAPGKFGTQMGSGANFHAANTNNPFIRMLHTVFMDARKASEKFSRDYLTSKDGFSTQYGKLSAEERVTMDKLLQQHDEAAQLPSDRAWAIYEQTYGKKVTDAMRAYYKADEAKLARWNAIRNELGMEPVEARPGHYPGIFSGAWKAAVRNKDGQIIAILSEDSRGALKAAKKYTQDKFKDATIQDIDTSRWGPQASTPDIVSGLNAVLDTLAKNDPEYAKVAQLLEDARSLKAQSNLGQHAKDKKGILGSAGNKPWMTDAKNAKQRYEAIVNYFQQGTRQAEQMLATREVGKFLDSDHAESMPKTATYMRNYQNHVMGNNLNPIGRGLDGIIDATFRAMGRSGKEAGGMSNSLKNFYSQKLMGWLNPGFTAAQVLQIPQTATPMMHYAAKELGVPVAQVATSISKGAAMNARILIEQMLTGKVTGSPEMLKLHQYMKDRGLLELSEAETVHSTTKSKALQLKDQLAEANIKAAEMATRPAVFLGIYDILKHKGMPDDVAMGTAENLTNAGMFDYHPDERPPIYSGLGHVGKMAGALTTFKHGYASEMTFLTKQALTKGNVGPAAHAITASIALAGLTGLLGYGEADYLVKFLTEKFGGKQQNLRELTMANLPEWLKTGLLSNATNVAMQSKISAAQTVPDLTNAGGLMPYAGTAAKTVAAGAEAIKKPSTATAGEFLKSIMPNSVAGFIEERFQKAPDGSVLNAKGEKMYPRTDEDWMIRKYSAARSQDEALSSNQRWRNIELNKLDKTTMKDIEDYSSWALLNNKPLDQKMLDKYQALGGNVANLINRGVSQSLTGNMDEPTRRQFEALRTKNPAARLQNLEQSQR